MSNNDWYAFRGYNNNVPVQVSEFDLGLLNAVGMHGYPTSAEAAAKPNSVNLLTAGLVNAAIDDANNARDVAAVPGAAAKAAKKAASAAAKDATGSLGSLIANAQDPSIWLRIAEGIIGVLLIATAVSKISGASTVGSAVRKIPLVT